MFSFMQSYVFNDFEILSYNSIAIPLNITVNLGAQFYESVWRAGRKNPPGLKIDTKRKRVWNPSVRRQTRTHHYPIKYHLIGCSVAGASSCCSSVIELKGRNTQPLTFSVKTSLAEMESF